MSQHFSAVAGGVIIDLILVAAVAHAIASAVRSYRDKDFRQITWKSRRAARRTAAVIVAFLIANTSFGLVEEWVTQPWNQNWALLWQRTPGDWILFALCLVVLAGGLLLVARGGPWEQVVLKWARKRQAQDRDREAIATKLAEEIPSLSLRAARQLLEAGDGMSLATIKLLQLEAAGKPVRLAATRRGRARQLKRVSVHEPALAGQYIPESTFRKTALHEAGHAVAYAALGQTPYYIMVRRPGDAVTGAAETGYTLDPAHAADRGTWHDLIVSVAGQVAENYQRRAWFSSGSLDDWFYAAQGAQLLYLHGTELNGNPPADGPAGWIAAAHAEAARIVGANWDTITAIAEALERSESAGRAVMGPIELDGLVQNVATVSSEHVTRAA